MKTMGRILSGWMLTVLAVVYFDVVSLAHEGEEGWFGHHMMGTGGWGSWPFMVLFWLMGFLIVVLLAVLIFKNMRNI